MLTWLLKRQIGAFESKYDYDMSYVRHMLAVDPAAVWTFGKVQALKSYRKDVPRDAYMAVALVGTLVADCGPCSQLMVSMALEEGVLPETIAAVVSERYDALSEEVRLASQFARASLAHSPEADSLRERIVQLWGERALFSLAFALVTSQLFPTLKYALGYGKTCKALVVGDTALTMGKREPEGGPLAQAARVEAVT